MVGALTPPRLLETPAEVPDRGDGEDEQGHQAPRGETLPLVEPVLLATLADADEGHLGAIGSGDDPALARADELQELTDLGDRGDLGLGPLHGTG